MTRKIEKKRLEKKGDLKKQKTKTKKNKNKKVKTQENNETSRQWQQETQEPMEKTQVAMERGLHTQLDPTFPEGGPTSSLTLPRDLAGGILGGGGVKNCFFWFFPRKKTEKNVKKTKKTIWEDPPFQTRGPPKFPATFTTFPDGAAKSAKFPQT